MTQDVYIDGEWQPGRGTAMVSTDPATGVVVWAGHGADRSQVEAAVGAAGVAASGWAARPYAARLAVCEAYREQLTTDQAGLAELISRETGKPLWECRQEVAAMIGKLALSDEAWRERCQDREREQDGTQLVRRFRPLGVVAVLGPFNFPGHLPNGHIIPALLAGNAVVLKPSEWTPAVAQQMARLWAAAGLPAGLLNVLPGGGEVGRELVAHPAVRGVFFTGSASTGLALRRQLVERPEVLLALELGGNNPLIVWEAEATAAARLVALSAWLSAGQRCTCARRLILPTGPAGDAVVAALTVIAAGLRIGLPADRPEPFMGPLIHAGAADATLAAQAALVAAGAQVLLPATRSARCPALLSPGLLDVTELAEPPDEEVFGPLLQIRRVPDLDRAIAAANATRFGLAAGVISESPAVFARVEREVYAGVITWNRPTTGASGSLPFGGLGHSGNHRPSGYLAADYCSVATAVSRTPHLTTPTAPPGFPG